MRVADKFRVDVCGELVTSNTVYYDAAAEQWSICVDRYDIKDDWKYCEEPDEYIGIQDTNNKPVYTGDIIRLVRYDRDDFIIGECTSEVTKGGMWNSYGVTIGSIWVPLNTFDPGSTSIQIIGNVHDVNQE